MRYLVMECHLSYAVVLAEDGRFLTVANRHYEVGQSVTGVVELQVPQAAAQTGAAHGKKRAARWLAPLAAMAACLVLVFAAVLQMGRAPYASVYLSINPEVRIDVDRRDTVVGLAGMNGDGDALIEGYGYQDKGLETVMDELVDLAIAMGYLHEGGRITLTLDADEQWTVSHEEALTAHLNEYLTEKISVTVEVASGQTGETPPVQSQTPGQQVTIPVDPPGDGYSESDYGDSGYDESPSPSPSDGDSGYDEPPSPSSGDGDSGYDESPSPSPSGGDSGYDESPSPSPSDGDSGYDESPSPSPSDGDSGYVSSEDDDGENGYGDSGYDDG